MISLSTLVFGVLLFAASYALSLKLIRLMADAEHSFDTMTTREVVFRTAGLIFGLIVAALCSVIILAAGNSLFTIALCGLMYVSLGYMGISIGKKRYRKRRRDDPSRLMEMGVELAGGDDEDEQPTLPGKVLDSSVLIDGRLAAVWQSGFLEGSLTVPMFIVSEMRRLADSAEEERRMRGRRGLDKLNELQLLTPVTIDETDFNDLAEVDAKLLRLCKQTGASLVTNDSNLIRSAKATGVTTLSLAVLSEALKPAISTGDTLTVTVSRKGKEPGQGVGYLEDGTMLVIENADDAVGKEISCTVTSVLRTSAGKMIFAKAA